MGPLLRGFFFLDLEMNGGISTVFGLSLSHNEPQSKNGSQAMSSQAKVVVIYNYDKLTQRIDLLRRCEAPFKKLKRCQRLWRLRDKERNTETIIVSL
jgi:hypothetical protein